MVMAAEEPEGDPAIRTDGFEEVKPAWAGRHLGQGWRRVCVPVSADWVWHPRVFASESMTLCRSRYPPGLVRKRPPSQIFVGGPFLTATSERGTIIPRQLKAALEGSDVDIALLALPRCQRTRKTIPGMIIHTENSFKFCFLLHSIH